MPDRFELMFDENPPMPFCSHGVQGDCVECLKGQIEGLKERIGTLERDTNEQMKHTKRTKQHTRDVGPIVVILLIVAAISGLVVLGLVLSAPHTSTIDDMYVEQRGDVDCYYFVMSDGHTVQVSEEDYYNHDVGDEYTYGFWDTRMDSGM